QYANLCFEGLREWWLKHSDYMIPAEIPALTAAVQWYPITWVSVGDIAGLSTSNKSVGTGSTGSSLSGFDWYTLDGRGSLTPYDVLSIPMSTLMDAIQHNKSIDISLWNTDGLMII